MRSGTRPGRSPRLSAGVARLVAPAICGRPGGRAALSLPSSSGPARCLAVARSRNRCSREEPLAIAPVVRVLPAAARGGTVGGWATSPVEGAAE